MRTTMTFGAPGRPLTWGSVLPSWSAAKCEHRGAIARPQRLRAATPIVDHCRSVRERIPDS